MKELSIQKHIQLALSEEGLPVWRNETGSFWSGKVIHRAGNQVTLADAKMVQCGLCKGSSDLISITPVTITADMIGQVLGVFTAPEVKTPKGRPSKEQVNFIERVNGYGGIAGIVRSPQDALDLVRSKRSGNT